MPLSLQGCSPGPLCTSTTAADFAVLQLLTLRGFSHAVRAPLMWDKTEHNGHDLSAAQGRYLVAAVLAEVGGPGRQGRPAPQAAQPHLCEAHDAARVRRGGRQRNAPGVGACSAVDVSP